MTAPVSSANEARGTDSRLKLLAALGFGLLATALVIIKINSPATGYELSIFSAFPWPAWGFLLETAFCGLFIIVDQAFYSRQGNFCRRKGCW